MAEPKHPHQENCDCELCQIELERQEYYDAVEPQCPPNHEDE